MADDDGFLFPVDGLQCKAYSSYKVKVGLNLPKKHRFLVNMKIGDDRESAVRRHAKFASSLRLLGQSRLEL